MAPISELQHVHQKKQGACPKDDWNQVGFNKKMMYSVDVAM